MLLECAHTRYRLQACYLCLYCNRKVCCVKKKKTTNKKIKSTGNLGTFSCATRVIPECKSEKHRMAKILHEIVIHSESFCSCANTDESNVCLTIKADMYSLGHLS
jgi:hypothetical protein